MNIDLTKAQQVQVREAAPEMPAPRQQYKETKQDLIRKVYDVMEPGGYLFIGRTETIDRNNVPFQLIQPSIFRK